MIHSVKTITLPSPASGETFRIRAIDSPVVIEGCDAPEELRPGETAAYVAVSIDAGLPTERRWWERVPALPGD